MKLSCAIKQNNNPHTEIRLKQLVLALLLWGVISAPVHACTIFVLTDTQQALFCNNEDWINPNTRIWFIPAGPTNFGCVYVGFDDGIPQGGFNTEGLAFDWVAGTAESWNPDPTLPISFGCRQMLETCKTVEDAITFFRGHRELGFYTSGALVADRTGTSVIIRAKAGKLTFDRSKKSRGLGYGKRNIYLEQVLNSAKPTLNEGGRILRDCVQEGTCATKYSNIFDLKSADILLFLPTDRDHPIKLNLAKELKKGGHYYDIPRLPGQLGKPPLALLPNLERCLMERFKPIPDTEPNVTARVRRIIQEYLNGTMHADDYTAAIWDEISLARKCDGPILKSFGPFISLTLVDRSENGDKRCYRYRMQCKWNTLLLKVVFDKQNKVAMSQLEDGR